MELLPDPDPDDFDELSQRLHAYDAGIEAILKEQLGPRWRFAKQEEENAVLTRRQVMWQSLRYFYEASIVNSADLFAYLPMVYAEPEMFREIGAVKTLAAAEALRGMHEHYQQLVAPEEQYAYTKQTEAERTAIEEQAEDMDEFAALMIAYAEAHPEDFPLAEPVDPIANLVEVFTDMRREAESQGGMDEAKKATMEAAEQAMKDFQAIFQGLREPEIEK